MAKYSKIKNFCISNGDGIGVAFFFTGCDANPKCKGCFNSELWDKNIGTEICEETFKILENMMSNPHIDHISFLGGEPFTDYNYLALQSYIVRLKELFPEKKIWVWTWRQYEDIFQDKERKKTLPYIDYLVDGRYIAEKRDLSLKYCGSTNQRVIDVQKSLKENKVVLKEEN